MAKRLLILNGLATLGVVLNHSTSWGFISMFWWTDQYLPTTVPNFDQLGSLSYYALRAIEQIVAFSVPVFLFVSGFFIAFVTGRSNSVEGWKLAGARIATLLTPYVLWSVVMFSLSAIQGTTYPAITYVKLLLIGGAAEPYYYIPLIIQLFLLAPILITISRDHWKPLLIIVALIQLGIQSLRYPYLMGIRTPLLDQLVVSTPGWFFPSKMLSFVLGIVFSLHLVEIKQWITRYRWLWAGAVVILIPLGMIEWELIIQNSQSDWVGYYDTALDSLYAITIILTFITIERLNIPFSKGLFFLGGQSYGIYLAHALVLIMVSKIIYNVVPLALAYQIVFQPILILLGLGVPLVLMRALNRSPLKMFYSYIFG